MAEARERIFVYGTLRRGASKDACVHYSGVRFVTAAKVRGRLYDFGDYPGLEPDENAPWVAGDLLDVTPAALVELDAWEGIGPNEPQPFPYERVRVTAVTEAGETETVWAYRVAPRYREGRPVLESGDWLRRNG